MSSFNQQLPASELKPGDVIRTLCVPPWDSAIVKQVKDGNITIFRPYGHFADYLTTSGVITYIGVEEYTIPVTSHMYWVYQRTELK